MKRLLILPVAALLFAQVAFAQQSSAPGRGSPPTPAGLQLAQSTPPLGAPADDVAIDAPSAAQTRADARAQVLQELQQTQHDTQLGRLDSLYAPR